MLKQQFQQDLKTALKEKKELETSVLRMVLASIQNKEKEKRYKLAKENPKLVANELDEKNQLTDEETVEVLFSELKKRKDSVEEFKKGKRMDLVEKEQAELEILKKYLPEQLSEQEIKKLAQETIEQIGAKDQKDIGKIMADLMPKLKGKADGAIISKIVKELLMQ